MFDPGPGFIYVEQENGRSAYNPVTPNEYGMLDPVWPRGFFDQTAEESKKIVESAVVKRVRQVQGEAQK